MKNYIEDTKYIMYTFIESKYREYLKENKILLINKEKINNVINEFYEENIKIMKNKIRTDLKDTYKDDYSSVTTENIIIDIFNSKDENIKKIVEEITFIQDNNLKIIKIPVINNSLNLNISLIEDYIVINSSNIKNIENYDEIYETINKYKFIYKINDKILDNYEGNEKINTIKEEILNNKEIELGVYYKKNNK